MSKIRDITGKKFGLLTAIKRVGSNKLGHSLWLFKCDCGNEIINLSNKVLTGNTSSCGCFKHHGMRYTRIYRTWINMKVRCYNNKEENFKNYGGKGINVCNEWKNDFVSFYNWALNNGYNDNLTIDRINYKEGYSPENCQWITISENVKRKIITSEVRKNMSISAKNRKHRRKQ